MDKSIRVAGLTKLDQIELEGKLGKSSVTFEKAPLASGDHGELATLTAVVLVSLSALRVLALYIVQKTDRKTFRKEIEIVTKDGRRKVLKIEWDTKSSEPPDAQVLKQLASACEVDASELLAK